MDYGLVDGRICGLLFTYHQQRGRRDENRPIQSGRGSVPDGGSLHSTSTPVHQADREVRRRFGGVRERNRPAASHKGGEVPGGGEGFGNSRRLRPASLAPRLDPNPRASSPLPSSPPPRDRVWFLLRLSGTKTSLPAGRGKVGVRRVVSNRPDGTRPPPRAVVLGVNGEPELCIISSTRPISVAGSRAQLPSLPHQFFSMTTCHSQYTGS
jgi:hypothetical protein